MGHGGGLDANGGHTDHSTGSYHFHNNTEPTPIPPSEIDEKTIIVYVTRTGIKYHRQRCRHLKKSSIPMALADAKVNYTPCKVCRPPW